MAWYKDDLQRVFKLKTFPNLRTALAYQDHANSERARAGKAPLFIFSREVSAEGHRYFFVETPNDFYDWYIITPEHTKTLYEVLLIEKPCRLFFDIEFEPRRARGGANDSFSTSVN